MFFEEFEQQKNCEINSAHQKLLGLVEMTSGLLASCKLDFLYTPNNIIVTRVFNVNEIKKVTFFYGILSHALESKGISGTCVLNCTKQKHAKLPYVCAINNYY